MAVKKSVNSEICWSKATVINIFRSLYQTDSCSFNFIGPWKKGTEIFSFFSFSQKKSKKKKTNIVLIMTINPFLLFHHLYNNTEDSKRMLLNWRMALMHRMTFWSNFGLKTTLSIQKVFSVKPSITRRGSILKSTH